MYGLRGCAPCVSCMGVRLVKGIKIFESISTKIYRCFKNHFNEKFPEKSY